MNLYNCFGGALKKKNLGSQMLVSGICRPLSMLIYCIYIPQVLSYLGVEKYGVWSTILSILSWVNYFDIGIGNGLKNRLTQSINNNKLKAKELISTAYAFTALIMIIVVLIFCVISSFLNWDVILGIGNIDEKLTAIINVSIIFVSSNFVLTTYKNVLYAMQEAIKVSILELVVQCGNLLGIMFLKQFSERKLFYVACIYGMSMVMVGLIGNVLAYKRNKEICPGLKSVNYETGKSLMNLGIKFFIIQICALVLFTTDNLIISYLYGAVNVTPYSVVNTIFNAIVGIHVAFLAPVWTAVVKETSEKNWLYLKELIKKLVMLMVPFGLGTGVLVILFEKIANIWLGYELYYNDGLILFGGFFCILSIWCNTFSYLVNGFELMKVAVIVAVIQAILNIPMSLYLAEGVHMGITGVLGGTVLSMVIAAIILPISVIKYVKQMSKGER